MDLSSRTHNAEQQTFELHKAFGDIEHRIREFTELQAHLIQLHEQVAGLKQSIGLLQSELATIHVLLPSLARKEDVQRFTEKIDSHEFELFATKHDL